MQKKIVNLRQRTYNTCFHHISFQLVAAVRLTPARRLEIAEEKYASAKMHGDSVQEAEAFLTRWRHARYLMLREGLIGNTSQQERDFLMQAGAAPWYIDRVTQTLVVNELR